MYSYHVSYYFEMEISGHDIFADEIGSDFPIRLAEQIFMLGICADIFDRCRILSQINSFRKINSPFSKYTSNVAVNVHLKLIIALSD
jgi:hypothetical protein